ncbi:MAG: hypothetical protein KBF43_11910 [Dermatophilaceae bacterium]|nr:hypothetical protein [Dermatophilaceae bacterium]MBP9919283.1 hypothetical protein [Dermatophilaceae bacterium]
MGSNASLAQDFSTPELPSWLLAVPFLLAAVVVGVVVWRRRDAWAAREIQAFGMAKGLPDPGEDLGWVTDRIRARLSGRLVGAIAGFVVSVPLIGMSVNRAGMGGWWLLLIPLYAVLGTAFGHLRPVTQKSDRPRVAALRERRVGDYVTQVEVWSAVICSVLPVATLVLAGLVWARGTSAVSAVVLSVVLAGVSLVVIVVLADLARRALAQNIQTHGASGLAWAELLRAQMLRDLVGGVSTAGAFGGGFVPFWGVVVTWREYPDWYLPVTFGLVALAVAALLAGLIAAGADTNLRWARDHTLGDPGPVGP